MFLKEHAYFSLEENKLNSFDCCLLSVVHCKTQRNSFYYGVRSVDEHKNATIRQVSLGFRTALFEKKNEFLSFILKVPPSETETQKPIN